MQSHSSYFPYLKTSICRLSLAAACYLAPAALADHIESNLDGSLQKIIKNYDSHAEEAFLLREEKRGKATGRIYELKFKEGFLPAGFENGDKVRVKGHLAHGKKNLVDLGGGDMKKKSSSTSSVPVAVTGNRSVLVLKVNTTNGSPSCTESSLATTMQKVSALNTAASFQSFTYSPVSVGTVSISYDSTSCDYNTVASLASTAYGSTGSFGSVVYVFNGNCGWAGLAYMPGTKAFINGSSCGSAPVYTHELGHNLGLHHASTDPENDGTINSEYGDYSSYMGSPGSLVALNGPHKVQAGWTTATNVSAPGGTFNVNALDAVQTGTVFKVTPTSGAPYYISFRGADPVYPVSASYQFRTAIHRHSGGAIQTRLITTLGDGQSFTDASLGLTITQLSHGTGSASVQFAWGCAVNTPAITLSPAVQTASTDGIQKDFTVTVKNNDSAGCGTAASFNIGSAVPSGWTGSLDSSSMSLGAGATGQTVLHVTSAAGSANGDFPITASVSSSGRSSAQASATYRIDSIKPTAPSNLIVSKRKRGKNLSINGTFGGSTDNYPGTIQYTVYRTNPLGATVVVTRATSLSFTDTLNSSSPTGTYSYKVTAVDSAGNESNASNTASIVK